MAINHCSDFKKFKTSSPKVENVVNPPHKPTIKKARKISLSPLCYQCFKQIPIKKAPKTLTSRVGQGKQYRKMYPKLARNNEPTAPPPATSRKNFQSIN